MRAKVARQPKVDVDVKMNSLQKSVDNVTWVPIESIQPWDKNPRRNEKAADHLAELLKEHGIKTPLVVWRENKTVYKGNTTLKAAKIAGFSQVPVSHAEFESEAAAITYALSDNKASEWADWDDDTLAELLSRDDVLSLDATRVTGFSERDIRGLSFQPNLGKLDKIKEGEEAHVARIVIRCKPEDKEEILATLAQWIVDSEYEEASIG